MKKFFKSLALIACSGMLIFTGCTGENSAKDEGNMASDVPNEDKLLVAMELAYPPFETKDDEGNPTGISVDLAYAIGDYVGREVEIVNTAWDGLIPSLQTEKADMVISSMTITEAREETVDFSQPYANSLLAMLVNINSPVETAEDLNAEEMSVAVKSGSTGHMWAEANLPNAQIIVLADESACVTEVAQGKADAFLYDQLTIYRNNVANAETTKAIFMPFQETDYWGVAVKSGNTELLTEINEFIVNYTEQGGFDELSEKYLSEEKKAFDELGFKWFFDLS